MSLFAIGDLHLSFETNKPMDIFGSDWAEHTERLKKGLSVLCPEDVLVLCGDFSWALSLIEATKDFQFLESFHGRKLIVKGNHDYWWSTAAKMKSFWQQIGAFSMDVLHNNTFIWGEYAICGTRGWFFEEDRQGTHDEKIFRREVGRLKMSLDKGVASGARELLCFLHYPPLYEGYRCDEIVDTMRDYGVKRCFYGHLHGRGRHKAIEGNYDGIEYRLVSADHVSFAPVKIF